MNLVIDRKYIEKHLLLLVLTLSLVVANGAFSVGVT